MMELWLLSKKWWQIKAGGGKENTKRNAYHEGDGHAFCKNRFIDEKTGGAGPRERCHDGHYLGHGLTHDT
jgi:hypothetical protein